MNVASPLVLVEDDSDDQELIQHAFRDLGLNCDIKIFRDAEAALKFLYETTVSPFLIISDMNMPKMDGIGFKSAIESCNILKGKCIPFVFLSTASSKERVNQAYELKAQGFFEKGSSYSQLKESLNTILDYWEKSKHPEF